MAEQVKLKDGSIPLEDGNPKDTLEASEHGTQAVTDVSKNQISDSSEVTMSKRQRKKIIKHQKWLDKKEKMRKYRKEKRKEERMKKTEKREATGEPPPKIYKMSDEQASQVTVVIDCDYDDLMSEKDIRQFVQQIQRCYSDNRRSPTPLQYYLCSLGGKTLAKIQECVQGYKHWDVFLQSEKPNDFFENDKVVYLTSDSPNVLDTLECDKVYVIGGLVDHNHYKGLCYERAVKAGLAHAQLPIAEYVQLQSRKVLTINHVFEILVRYVQSGDWKEAFMKTIPQRKGVSDVKKQKDTEEATHDTTEKQGHSKDGDNNDDDDDDDDDNNSGSYVKTDNLTMSSDKDTVDTVRTKL